MTSPGKPIRSSACTACHVCAWHGCACVGCGCGGLVAVARLGGVIAWRHKQRQRQAKRVRTTHGSQYSIQPRAVAIGGACLFPQVRRLQGHTQHYAHQHAHQREQQQRLLQQAGRHAWAGRQSTAGQVVPEVVAVFKQAGGAPGNTMQQLQRDCIFRACHRSQPLPRGAGGRDRRAGQATGMVGPSFDASGAGLPAR